MFKIRLAGFLLASLLTLPAWAAPVILHVTNAADSGSGTLRQAIINGNALPGNDYPRIVIDLGTNNPILLQSALPTLTRSVVYIEGAAATPAAINGLSQHAILRVDRGDSGIVSLSHLTLRNGSSDQGGCLYLGDSAGLTVIDDVWFSGCSARSSGGASTARGGAIAANGGILAITDSRFTGNVSEGPASNGGAIYFKAYPDVGSVSIRDTEFSLNTAYGADGGWSKGGALYIGLAKLTIADSIFHDNWAVASDFNDPPNASNAGGAISSQHSSVTVQRSTFTLNRSHNGGAIYTLRGLDGGIAQGLTLVNNTFVGNRASNDGGGVAVAEANTVLRNNSFFLNQADNRYGNFHGTYFSPSGGIPSYEIWNNLLTNQQAGASCHAGGSVNSGYNIIPGNGCDMESQSSNLMTNEVHLQGYRLAADPSSAAGAPLRFFVDSPALDTGNPNPPDDDDIHACPELDGQGNPRSIDGDVNGTPGCDIGAYEWQHEASLFADDFEDRLTAADS